jgi:hypothetical protein
LSTAQDLAKVRDSTPVSSSEPDSAPAPENVPPSTGASSRYRKRAKTGINQSARRIFVPVSERQERDMPPPPQPVDRSRDIAPTGAWCAATAHACVGSLLFVLLMRYSQYSSSEAAAFFAQNLKLDTSTRGPSPFSVLVSASIKGPDQKIFRHHDSSLASEDIILLFDLLAGEHYIRICTEFCCCGLHRSRDRPLPERCPNLETLDLENNKLDAEAAFAIAAGLQKLPLLRRLDLVSVAQLVLQRDVVGHCSSSQPNPLCSMCLLCAVYTNTQLMMPMLSSHNYHLLFRIKTGLVMLESQR